MNGQLDAKGMLARYTPVERKTTLKPDRQLGILRFSPSGTRLAAGGLDARIRVWELVGKEFEERPALEGHHGWVQALAFLPDGKRLVTGDSWGRLICHASTDERAKALWSLDSAHDGWIREVASRSDGGVVATVGADRHARFWSTEDGSRALPPLPHDEDVFSIAFGPDGKSVLTGDLRGKVRVWDLDSGKSMRTWELSLFHKLDRIQDVGGVRRLSFSRDGKTLACSGTRPKTGGFVQGVPTLVLMEWPSGKVVQEIAIGGEADGFIHDIQWHPDGFVMGVTSGQPGNGKLFFHRPGDAQPFFLANKPANGHSLTLHPEGRVLAVAATNTGSSGNGRRLENGQYKGNWSPIHLWDLPGAAKA